MKGIFYALLYLGWIFTFRLLTLTLTTYFFKASGAGASLREISDAFNTHVLTLTGLGALSFILILRAFNPLSSVATDEIITRHRFEKRFIPGLIRGSILGAGIIGAFLLSNSYRYVGFLIQSDETPLALLSIFIRAIGIIFLIYCEEFIFRYKILNSLKKKMPDLLAILLTALFFCVTKTVQFELSWMHLVTLFLMSIAVSYRALWDGDFGRGAGFWAGLLLVIQPLCSLPLFGTEFSGLFIIKNTISDGQPNLLEIALCGGAGGPLSSLALQLMLCIDIAHGLYLEKRTLWQKHWSLRWITRR